MPSFPSIPLATLALLVASGCIDLGPRGEVLGQERVLIAVAAAQVDLDSTDALLPGAFVLFGEKIELCENLGEGERTNTATAFAVAVERLNGAIVPPTDGTYALVESFPAGEDGRFVVLQALPRGAEDCVLDKDASQKFVDGTIRFDGLDTVFGGGRLKLHFDARTADGAGELTGFASTDECAPAFLSFDAELAGRPISCRK